jgi:hypothetical protein
MRKVLILIEVSMGNTPRPRPSVPADLMRHSCNMLPDIAKSEGQLGVSIDDEMMKEPEIRQVH